MGQLNVHCTCIQCTCMYMYFYLLFIFSYRYRHTLDELHDLVSIAENKADLFCVWSEKVDRLLDGFEQPRPDIEFMKDLKFEAERQSLVQCDQYQELCASIVEAEKLQQDVCKMGRSDK